MWYPSKTLSPVKLIRALTDVLDLESRFGALEIHCQSQAQTGDLTIMTESSRTIGIISMRTGEVEVLV